MSSKTILITGAGTGFGKEIALQASAAGHHVIAGVEITAQIADLSNEAKRRGLDLQLEKLDVTDAQDRDRAQLWPIDILLNYAGISEGGSVVDIPYAQLQRQFEVNVFGPVLLTQGIAKSMARRGQGMVIFMSSVAGLTVDPFTGAYAGSKHAVEAFAEALRKEMLEFNVQVATINPGPFLTGFNDRMFETWQTWASDPKSRLFDYSSIAFPHKQFDFKPVVDAVLDVIEGRSKRYRNVVLKAFETQVKDELQAVWDRSFQDGLGTRHELVQAAYDLKPATPVE
ncbi:MULTISPECIES: SDR family oxidoreductase [unclassified Pseudomonas]|uniref:SDR family oxidoreductase n=1 Tax=unclassified Pseudomonas TaxID=196821 RepID=UPI000D394EC6|nr:MULTISPECIES: SDR family oxidoreductase [unclassified Pseudomonas]RAU43855.1 short-chain dehydrogenase [Pseudomonas sp. RIT 409]RAU56251.1 short-chain dehydrogenase [Pseudomonas sp. RIT 412]